MKNTKRCPKCQSDEIVRIPGHDQAYGGYNYMLGLKEVQPSKYVCCHCGFAEEYIETQQGIERIKKYKLSQHLK